jgi:hypothetical protein
MITELTDMLDQWHRPAAHLVEVNAHVSPSLIANCLRARQTIDIKLDTTKLGSLGRIGKDRQAQHIVDLVQLVKKSPSRGETAPVNQDVR